MLFHRSELDFEKLILDFQWDYTDAKEETNHVFSKSFWFSDLCHIS